MGFNSVRIHHHEAFLVGAKPRGDGAALDVPSWNWKKFDALVAACIRHGLYITTDLFVSRTKGMTWRAIGIDRDGTVPDREFKLMCAFYEPAYSNLVEWTRIFMTHKNRFTGRSLAEEPALCGIGLINEGNLGRDGVDGLKKCPGFAKAWAEWCAARPGGSASAQAGGSGGSVPRPLPTDVYGSTTTHGELALFLAEREAMLFSRLRALLRDELGCNAPLSNLNAGYYPGQYLQTMRDFDYIDTHFYYFHPRFLGKNWRFPTVIDADNPFMVNGGVPSATWRRVLGKPFCITEWNWAAPGRQRSAAGLATGSLAALQNWSGIWRFAWSHTKEGVEAPGSMPIRFFDLHSDPVQRASEYATLALYLRGDMPPLPPDAENAETWREDELRDPKRGAVQFGSPRKGVSAWKCRVGTRLAADAAVPAANEAAEAENASGGDRVQSNASDNHVSISQSGSMLIATPRTCGGFAESGRINAGPLSFEICAPAMPMAGSSSTSTFSRSFDSSKPDAATPVTASVWASSLDGAPIASSKRLLVAHVTDAANSGAVFDGPEARSWMEQGATPALVRRGRATITLALEPHGSFAAPSSNVSRSFDSSKPVAATSVAATVFRLSPTGHRVAEVPASFDPVSGKLSFTADTGYDHASATFFYEIVR